MIYKLDIRINGCKTLEDIKTFMKQNKIKIIFFAETHGILDELKIQDEIISNLKPVCYLYELLEETILILDRDFINFLEKNNSEKFSIISSFGELKPVVRLAKKHGLPLIGCDVKNMYRNNRDFLKETDFNKEKEIMSKREERQIEVIRKSLKSYGAPVFVSIGIFHLRKNSPIFNEFKSNYIFIYPLIDNKKLEDLGENFNIENAKQVTYVIESSEDGQ